MSSEAWFTWPSHMDALIENIREAHAKWTASAQHESGVRLTREQRTTVRMWEQICARHRQSAAGMFANANGWNVSSQTFGLNSLKSGKRLRWSLDIIGGSDLDHPDCFLRDRRPIALVVHNYNGRPPWDHTEIGWVQLPESWYYPGMTQAWLGIRVPAVLQILHGPEWSAPQSVPSTSEESAMREFVKLYREGDDFAIQSNINDEGQFIRQASVTLGEALEKRESRSDALLAVWLPLVVDMCASLRGYKSPLVDQQVVRTAGRIYPSESLIVAASESNGVVKALEPVETA